MVFDDQEIAGLPFAVALIITDELRNGEVTTMEYLFPNFSMTKPTSVKPTTEATPLPERAPTTAAIVEVVDEPKESVGSAKIVVGGGPTAAINDYVPGRMC